MLVDGHESLRGVLRSTCTFYHVETSTARIFVVHGYDVKACTRYRYLRKNIPSNKRYNSIFYMVYTGLRDIPCFACTP
jgi:hypothetical protein